MGGGQTIPGGLYRVSTVLPPLLYSSSTVPPRFFHSFSVVLLHCFYNSNSVPSQSLQPFSDTSSTVLPHLFHSLFTFHTQFPHSSSTALPQLFHSSSTLRPQFVHSSSTVTVAIFRVPKKDMFLEKFSQKNQFFFQMYKALTFFLDNIFEWFFHQKAQNESNVQFSRFLKILF